MEQQEYCPICGQELQRGGCRYCAPAPALFCNGVMIVLEWCDQAGVKLARIKRVTRQEEKER